RPRIARATASPNGSFDWLELCNSNSARAGCCADLTPSRNQKNTNERKTMNHRFDEPANCMARSGRRALLPLKNVPIKFDGMRCKRTIPTLLIGLGLLTAAIEKAAALPPGNTVAQWNTIAEDTVVGSGAFQNEGL